MKAEIRYVIAKKFVDERQVLVLSRETIAVCGDRETLMDSVMVSIIENHGVQKGGLNPSGALSEELNIIDFLNGGGVVELASPLRRKSLGEECGEASS